MSDRPHCSRDGGDDPLKKVRYDDRKMTRSKMAAVQPRDEKGRFARYETMIVVDEFGNTGQSRPHERNFGYALSVTKDPERFGNITDSNRRSTGDVSFKNQ